jgi:polyisoprenyl-phosphate glycosyltransferase
MPVSVHPSFQISILIPVFNEELVLPTLFSRLDTLLGELPHAVEVVLVDDGSKDSTPVLIHQKAMEDHRYHSISLARNFGHQTALTAAMREARGSECVFIIDGDLQDPPELLPKFYSLLKDGYDVVYGVRRERKEGWLKVMAYHYAYRLIRLLANLDIPLDSGDYAMLSRRVVNAMNAMPESSRYLRGLRAWVGFRQIGLEYARSERHAGETKYSFRALLRLASKGVINFSELPVRVVSWLGVLSVACALLFFAYTLYRKAVFDDVPSGFTALLGISILFHGVTLICIGLLGEYLLRIFMEQKGRPLYIRRDCVRDGKLQEC